MSPGILYDAHMRFREPAICLRTTDFSETSQVVTFLTRGEGVVRLLAKGTKRPKSKSGGMIDLLGEGDLVYSHSGRNTLGTLMEFSETSSHARLRRNARRLNISLFMLELVHEMFAEGDPHPEVFDLLHKGLARLEDADAPVDSVLAYYQWRLLRHAGLIGELTRCVSCGRNLNDPAGNAGQGHFSSSQGGLLCRECTTPGIEGIVVGPDTLAGFATLTTARSGRRATLSDSQASSMNRLLAYHIQHQFGKGLRMARYAIAPAAGRK